MGGGTGLERDGDKLEKFSFADITRRSPIIMTYMRIAVIVIKCDPE
jgi:hypothetical protein